MQKSNKPSVFSRFCFKIIRGIIWFFYPKVKVVGTENLPEEPCILVGNHSQMHGPIICELHFPGKRAIWCAAQMMHLKEVPAYAFQDFWSGKPKWTHWFYRLLSYLIAPIATCIFQNANTIAVRRDNRIINTFRDTVNALGDGKNVIIFPECYTPHNNIVHKFQENFVNVAKLYYKRTGKAVKFVPLYIAPKLRTAYIGQPVDYAPEADQEQERSRICAKMMQAITDIAVSLPEHTVVPYPNLPKKQYPKNIPLQEEPQ